ncbi:MAG: NfeD family protein [Proteobacteria bacterium]|jgi:membrane protein implicated in regulation of membrane protease activity|nr:NfeD family protein [Alphaproteobacteria bacterium]NCC04014.1 NfeD family protein [Pseudomonadota bacterium]
MENMMFEPLWWHWALVGFGFILAELAMPVFVLVWFGLAGFLVMLALLVVPTLSLTVQLLLWTILSVCMMALWFRIFRRSYHKVLVGRSSANLVGEVGLIVQAVAPFQAGRVRFQKPLVGSDLWDCTAEEEISVGMRVRVESVEGNKVVVKKV